MAAAFMKFCAEVPLCRDGTAVAVSATARQQAYSPALTRCSTRA